MSNPIRPIGVRFLLARSVAIAALMSALAAMPLSSIYAQTKPSPAPAQTTPAKPTAVNPADKNGIEQRIQQLHADLKITPGQESKWTAVAQAMRDNATNLDRLVAEKRQQSQANMTAVDELQTFQQFAQAQLDGLKNLTSAFTPLYSAMSDQQKKNADEVFAKLNRPPPQGAPNRNG